MNEYPFDTIFVILWGINTIALWMRLTFFMVLSTNLGPMIRMVQRMMVDIVTFLEIIGIILLSTYLCLEGLVFRFFRSHANLLPRLWCARIF